jgi:pimeloyl-ACP methyl ester carboxylesterase
VLIGLSAGGWPTLEYTLRHPEKVRRLILIATGASGSAIREANPAWETIPEMIRVGWGQQNSAAYQMFLSLVNPRMNDVQRAFISELLANSTSGEDAANFLDALMEFDLTDRLGEVSVPTLVIHARGDLLVPFEAGGRILADGIPGAKLVVLETDAHGIPPNDETYPEMIAAMDAFLDEDPELADAR